MRVDHAPVVCAWCERRRTTEGSWEDADLRLADDRTATHGICPDCLAEQTRAAYSALEAR